jgi:hypothetical protein
MSSLRRIETQLFLAQQDVAAALLLAAKDNRYALGSLTVPEAPAKQVAAG